MRNIIGSTIAGLALMATTAFGSVTNAPVITSIKTEIKPAYPSRVYVTLAATNCTQGVRYFVNESPSLSSAFSERTSNIYNSTSDLGRECSTTFFYTGIDPLKDAAFFKVATKKEMVPQ